MHRGATVRSALLASALLVAALLTPAGARAQISGPRAVMPGEQVTYTAPEAASLEISVLTWPTHASQLATVPPRDGGTSRFSFRWPRSYQLCPVTDQPAGGRGCERRRFFPGQQVSLTACTEPATGGDPALGYEISAISCFGAPAVIDRRFEAAGVVLRPRERGRAVTSPGRVGVAGARVRGLRWTGWGTASAVGRGRAGGRPVRLAAGDIVDCGGRLHYSSLRMKRRGRRAAVLERLAPCQGVKQKPGWPQVFPGLAPPAP